MTKSSQTRATATTAKKPAPKKPAPKKTATKASTQSVRPLEQAANTVQKVVYGQLGIYGFILDGVTDSVVKLRANLPEHWDDLVERGKKVEKDLWKTEKDVRAWIKDYSAKDELKQAVENTKDLVDNVKERISRAA